MNDIYRVPTIQTSTPTTTNGVAQLPIDFIVIGGGVAGLACAAALGRTGHRVKLFEKKGSFQVSRAARLPPTESKILREWGLETELRKHLAPRGLTVFSMEGDSLGLYKFHANVLEEANAEYTYIHETTLREALYRSALSHGAQIHFSEEVQRIDVPLGAGQPSVTLANGQMVRADVVVGADGLFGITRRTIIGGKETSVQAHAVVYQGVVPKDKVNLCPGIPELIEETGQGAWFGQGNNVIGWAVGPSKEQDFCIQVLISKKLQWDSSTRLPPLTADALPRNCDPRLKKMVELAMPKAVVPVGDAPPLDDFVHPNGKVVALGNAAHLILPGGITSCSLSIGDAAVLSRLFSHLQSPDQIPPFLTAFHDLRAPRRLSVSTYEARDLSLLSAPLYQNAEECARALAAHGLDIVGGGGDEVKEEAYDEIRVLMGYDAVDAAEEWWVRWGLLRERAKSTGMVDSGGEGVVEGMRKMTI